MKDWKKVILCPNPSRDHDMCATKTAKEILERYGFRTVVCSPFRDQREGTFADLDVRPLTQELRSADLMITFGGDGTILHLAKLAALNKVPVLGVNTGSLGFIAELELSELDMLCRLESWDFKTESRMMLDVSVLRDGRQVYTNLGLNDAVIREGPISHVIHLRIESDAHHLADIAGDGVIIATPTGSTAYSFSAGGPVLDAAADVVVLTPVCAHNAQVAPLVFAAGRKLELVADAENRDTCYACADSTAQCDLRPGDVLTVTAAPQKLQLITFYDSEQFHAIENKLMRS